VFGGALVTAIYAIVTADRSAVGVLFPRKGL
jgi:hypothetical protein